MPDRDKPIAVFFEHPEWFKPLFAELERRGVPYERLLAGEHHFDPGVRESPYSLVVNRMSPSAFTRGGAHAIPYTLHYLAYLKDIGANVLNGYDAYRYEFSKARQLGLLAALGLRYPRARVINHSAQARAAAEGLRYPVVVKPNIGGSGAGIRRFDSPEALGAAAGELDLGLDGTALVQEYLAPEGASIVRVEVLGGELLYAIRLRLESPDSFNLCPADYCRPGDTGPSSLVEAYTPPGEVIEAVKRIAEAARLDVGGVEYLMGSDGHIYYYDVNALSNFVADAPRLLGFDPFDRLVDLILARAGYAERLVSSRT